MVATIFMGLPSGKSRPRLRGISFSRCYRQSAMVWIFYAIPYPIRLSLSLSSWFWGPLFFNLFSRISPDCSGPREAMRVFSLSRMKLPPRTVGHLGLPAAPPPPPSRLGVARFEFLLRYPPRPLPFPSRRGGQSKCTARQSRISPTFPTTGLSFLCFFLSRGSPPFPFFLIRTESIFLLPPPGSLPTFFPSQNLPLSEELRNTPTFPPPLPGVSDAFSPSGLFLPPRPAISGRLEIANRKTINPFFSFFACGLGKCFFFQTSFSAWRTRARFAAMKRNHDHLSLSPRFF